MVILIRLVSSEKAVREIENNILLFVVAKNATKEDIRRELETKFKIKVKSVRTYISPTGDKRAYVRLMPESSAADIADKIGGTV
jgi:large subunit ribosomal protein L23